MHLYGIFDLMRVMRKWGHPQLAVCPRFLWQNQMCVPDLHLLQTHPHTKKTLKIVSDFEISFRSGTWHSRSGTSSIFGGLPRGLPEHI